MSGKDDVHADTSLRLWRKGKCCKQKYNVHSPNTTFIYHI